MSGIFGKIGPIDPDPGELVRMSAALAHRGPDDDGLRTGKGIGLGCRLLRASGAGEPRQPVSDAAGSVWAVLDGAIYNAATLRKGLEERRGVSRGEGDAGLLVGLYTEYGTDFVGRLRGQFAFAIWDGGTRRLLLARDQLGQKPLFYAELPSGFYFASEIKALLPVLPSRPELDLEALDRYLSMRFVPGERTMVRGIRKVRPAHWLIHDGTRRTSSRYWQLSFAKKVRLSEDEYVEGLERKFEETVGCHMTPDGSSGAFLSGGLDSSLIVAMMARRSETPVPTFSIGFAEKEFDEIPYARIVSDRFKTRQIEAIAKPDLIRSIPSIVHGLDEPSDPVAASFFTASALAARHVKVALGGDGGNELFAGPDRYRGVLLTPYYAWIPAPIRRALVLPLIHAIPASFGYDSVKTKLRWFERMALRQGIGERLAEAVAFFRFNEDDKARLLTPAVQRQLEPGSAAREISDRYDESDAEDPIDRMAYTDYCTRLPEHLLMLVDRMGMMHGLEVRSPLVDKELVEYMATFPVNMKVRGRHARYVWYKLAERLLPESIAKRKKRGFRFPLARWFAVELQPFLLRAFADSALAADGFFEPESMARILEEHRERKADHNWKIWMLLNLEVWYRLRIANHPLADVESWVARHSH